MAPRATSTIEVYPETRAEIERRAAKKGITPTELLAQLFAGFAEGEAWLAELVRWEAEHADELDALAREPYPLDPGDIPSRTPR